MDERKKKEFSTAVARRGGAASKRELNRRAEIQEDSRMNADGLRYQG
jgi:hypothetical protein